MKDKDTRRSKGVAFILFLDKESAQNCSRALNNKQVSANNYIRESFQSSQKSKDIFLHFSFSCLEE